jgi:hypothetical protein
MSAWTRRLSSTSATRTIHEHNHEIIRSPARLIAAAARPACAGRGGDLPDGVEAPSATTTAGSGWRRRLLPSCDPRGPLRRASTWHQPRVHGSGAARQCRPAPRVMWRRHHEDGCARTCANASPMTELRPNPIRSDTSRRETAGAPAGEPDAARRCPAHRGTARWTRRLRRSRLTNPARHVDASVNANVT